MKKSLILGLAIAIAIAVPVIVGAITTPNECCKVYRTISDMDGQYKASGVWSDINTVSETGADTNPDSMCTVNKIAGPDENAQCSKGAVDTKGRDWGNCCLMSTIYRITDWIFYILLAIAFLFGLWAAVLFVTARGNTEQTETARNTLMYMIIGLIVAVVVKVIPAVVRAVVGL